jgi:hypothetical protein
MAKLKRNGDIDKILSVNNKAKTELSIHSQN